jgi:hypothetical protein
VKVIQHCRPQSNEGANTYAGPIPLPTQLPATTRTGTQCSTEFQEFSVKSARIVPHLGVVLGRVATLQVGQPRRVTNSTQRFSRSSGMVHRKGFELDLDDPPPRCSVKSLLWPASQANPSYTIPKFGTSSRA